MPVSADINRHLTGEYEKECCGAMCDSVPTCCFFYCCTPCAIYVQRQALLEISGEPYVMCAGTWPCCGFEKPCPPMCLFVESFCCMGRAVTGNRFMTQSRLNLRNTSWDGCLTCCHIFPGCECLIGRLCCGCSKERENLYKSGCAACMCTHCENEMAIAAFRRDRSGLAMPPAALVEELPEHFARVNRQTVAVAPAQVAPM